MSEVRGQNQKYEFWKKSFIVIYCSPLSNILHQVTSNQLPITSITPALLESAW